MKLLILIFVLFCVESFAVNFLLKNENIIDIGHNQESSEIEVPKERILKDPNIKLIDNKIVYARRLQSQKFDCETDFLGAETCPKEQTVCPSSIQYTDGYSIAHHVEKKLLKICSPWDISEGDKCYLDKNNDEVKDFAHYIQEGGYVWFNEVLHNLESKESSGTKEIKPYGYIEVRHYSAQACDNDNNHVVVKINDTSKIDTKCPSSRETGNVKVYENNTTSSKNVNYYLYDAHSGLGGWDASNMLLYTYKLDIDVPGGYIPEKDGDAVVFYKNSFCPDGSTEQKDGTCLMEYDWYSYQCPSDLNDYGIPWKVIIEGSDCGDISCTNSKTPPEDNCVRVNYVCPLDSSMQCGKTDNEIGFCEEGYVWNSNRCERIETFCGTSTYNAVLDVCQNVSTYTKLCANSDEIYDENRDKCVSKIVACEDGVYSEKYNKCIMDFVADCEESGYVYNPVSDVCENEEESLCQTQYNYSTDRGICIGEMLVCESGYIYDPDSKKCLEEICNILDTSDSGTRCETASLCDGVIKDGNCIPNEIQE